MTLSPKSRKAVAKGYGENLLAKAKRAMGEDLDTVLEIRTGDVVKQLTGRDALQAFEMRPIEQWQRLWAKFPRQTEAEMRNFARLTKKYRRLGPAGIEVVA